MDYFNYMANLTRAHAAGYLGFDYDAHIVGTPEYLEPTGDPEPPIGFRVRWSPDCEPDSDEVGEVVAHAEFGLYTVRFPSGERTIHSEEWEVVR